MVVERGAAAETEAVAVEEEAFVVNVVDAEGVDGSDLISGGSILPPPSALIMTTVVPGFKGVYLTFLRSLVISVEFSPTD